MYILKRKDFELSSQTLGKAFFKDPIWISFVPDDEYRKVFMPQMFTFLMQCIYRFGTIIATSENMEGIIIWSHSKKASINFWRIITGGFIKEKFRFFINHKEEMEIMKKEMTIIEKDRKKLMKGIKHIYLMAIGVDPQHQGQGNGGKLLKHLFNESKQLNIPIYLETETKENVRIYQHYRFKIIQERDFREKNFHLWQMVRQG